MARKRRSALQAAEKLVSRGRLEAAVKQYRKALEESPNDTGTLNRLGDLYARLNRVSEAVEMFSSAAEHFTKEGFFVKAIAIYKKIIRLDPTLINVYETLADLYYRQGLVNEARAQYQVVADYYRQSNNQSALVTVYEKMVELEPNNPSHRLKLAEFYCAAEKIPEAMEQYQRIATFMLDHGKVEESFKVYVGAFELKPDDLGFLTDVIVQLIDLDRTEIAQRLLNEAIAKNPDAVRVAELVDLPVVEAAERRGTLDAESEPALAQGSDFEPVAEAELSTPEDEAEISEVVELDLDQDAGPASDLLAEATGASSVSEDAAEADAVELVDLADLVSLDSTDAPPELAADVEPESPVGVEMDALAEDDEPEPERVDAKDETGEFEIDLAELEEAAIEAAVAEEPESAIEAAVAEESESAEFEEAAIEAAVAEEPESAELEEAAIEAAAAEEPESAELEEAAIEAAAAEEPESADLEAAEPAEPEAPEVEVPVGESLELAADAAARADELVTEASVLSNYSLESKAAELLETALELAPDHVEAARLLLHLHHQAERPDAVCEVAERFLRDGELPEPLDQLLQDWSYSVAEGRISAPAVEPTAPEPVLIGAEEPPSSDTRLTWLDEHEAGSSETDAAMFGEEDQFFDLAAELEEELIAEESRLDGAGLPQLEEQSIEEIVEGFKQGVAETLSSEDYDTHFNLGIAYREMGLVDEAIGEFQLAAKSKQYLVDCCSLLGASFLEKGFPDLAVKWYQRGLTAPDASDEEKLGLLYELGNLYLSTGDKDTARDTFAEIYGANSNYRDVVAKLEELR